MAPPTLPFARARTACAAIRPSAQTSKEFCVKNTHTGICFISLGLGDYFTNSAMPSKKKKYNARFPAGRIKKIMQSDEEIGKVAQAVPVIISRTLELFVESLLTKTLRITNSRNAKTLSPSHMRQCIVSEKRFDFLKELVRNIPDISVAEEAAYNEDDMLRSSPEDQYPDSDTPYDLSLPSTSMRSQSNNGTASTAAYMRSMSLNGGGGAGTKRQQQQLPPHLNPTHTLPAKLARSESTPAYTPGQRGRPPNSHSQHHKKQPVQLDTAIPAPICSYELNKPIVKIDYSNVQMRSLCTPEAAVSAPATNSGAAFNFDIAAPVINIDLTNIVAAGAGVGAASSRPTSIGFAPADNNNVNQMAGKSSAPIIPKATAAPSATPTETIFELDEDYDNI